MSTGETSPTELTKSSPQRVSKRTSTRLLVKLAPPPPMADVSPPLSILLSASKSLLTSVKSLERTDLMPKASSKTETPFAPLR